jgi:hypothetical protein
VVVPGDGHRPGGEVPGDVVQGASEGVGRVHECLQVVGVLEAIVRNRVPEDVPDSFPEQRLSARSGSRCGVRAVRRSRFAARNRPGGTRSSLRAVR